MREMSPDNMRRPLYRWACLFFAHGMWEDEIRETLRALAEANPPHWSDAERDAVIESITADAVANTARIYDTEGFIEPPPAVGEEKWFELDREIASLERAHRSGTRFD